MVAPHFLLKSCLLRLLPMGEATLFEIPRGPWEGIDRSRCDKNGYHSMTFQFQGLICHVHPALYVASWGKDGQGVNWCHVFIDILAC